jgi:Mg-chelatase subunit ChlI
MKNLLRLAMRDMIGLTDYQLKIVMNAARSIPVEKRDTFLQRIAAMLALRGRGRFTDTDVADVAHLALAGLVQTADRAA